MSTPCASKCASSQTPNPLKNWSRPSLPRSGECCGSSWSRGRVVGSVQLFIGVLPSPLGCPQKEIQSISKCRNGGKIPWFFVFVGTRFRMWNPSWTGLKNQMSFHWFILPCDTVHGSEIPKQPPGMVLKPCTYWFVQLPFPQLFWTPEKSLKSTHYLPSKRWGWLCRFCHQDETEELVSGLSQQLDSQGNPTVTVFTRHAPRREVSPRKLGEDEPTHFEKHHVLTGLVQPPTSIGIVLNWPLRIKHQNRDELELFVVSIFFNLCCWS